MTQRKSGVAAEHLREERRRRRHRQVIRNRIIFGAACVLVLVLIIFAIVKLISAIFGNKYTPPESSMLETMADGSVVFHEVQEFDEELYDKKAFKEQAISWVESFNEAMGEDAISIEYLKVKDDVAYVETVYKDAEAYTAFTSYPLFVGAVDAAVEAGYDFSDVFVSVDGQQKGAQIEADGPGQFLGYDCVIIKQNTTVKTHGPIQYISKYSTELQSDNSVKITPEDGNMDSTDLVYIIYSYSEYNVE